MLVRLSDSSRFLGVLYTKRKRNLVVLSMSSTALIVLGPLLLFPSWFLGLLVAKILGSKETGSPSKIPSVILPLGICRVHLHHWLICCGAMAFVLLRGPWFFPSEVAYGFLSGVALQGIYCYDDWHRIFILRRRRSLPCAVTEPAKMLDLDQGDWQAKLQSNSERVQSAILS